MGTLRLDSLYQDLLKGLVLNNQDEQELLLWMSLLHSHEIHLREPCLEDAPGITVVQPATQRSGAEAVAALWGDRRDSERTSYTYWYRLFELEKLEEKMRKSTGKSILRPLKEKLEAHPLVEAVKLQP